MKRNEIFTKLLAMRQRIEADCEEPMLDSDNALLYDVARGLGLSERQAATLAGDVEPSAMKALVIGRHEPDFGTRTDIEVIAQEAVTFKSSANMVEGQIWGLIKRMGEIGAGVLLFQNTPGQVAVALTTMVRRQERGIMLPLMGVIVSVPGERPEKKTVEFGLNSADPWDSSAAVQAVRFANPRAQVKAEGFAIEVTVVPPMRFKFSHIEWLTGDAAQEYID
jgi:hypothetical protein